jgi:quinol monooxygenase YgiN
MASLFISRWKLKPECRQQFEAIMDGLIEASGEVLKAETTVMFYGWGRDENEFVAIESWRSEEVVNAVRQSDGFKQALSAMMECCSAPMEMEVFADKGNDRSVFDQYPKGKSKVHPEVGNIHGYFI